MSPRASPGLRFRAASGPLRDGAIRGFCRSGKTYFLVAVRAQASLSSPAGCASTGGPTSGTATASTATASTATAFTADAATADAGGVAGGGGTAGATSGSTVTLPLAGSKGLTPVGGDITWRVSSNRTTLKGHTVTVWEGMTREAEVVEHWLIPLVHVTVVMPSNVVSVDVTLDGPPALLLAAVRTSIDAKDANDGKSGKSGKSGKGGKRGKRVCGCGAEYKPAVWYMATDCGREGRGDFS